jgi:FAD/FMN-containing dehydrogenase
MAASSSGPSGLVVTDADLRALRAGFRGPVFRLGDGGYDDALAGGRRGEEFAGFVWNARFAGCRPAAIVRPSTPADVMAAVNFAREGGWRPAVRGGGHNAAGLSTCDGDLVIDLGQMRGVRVDPGPRTARVDGGATWWDVDRNTQVYGLAAPGGSIAHTGVGGLTLGGGHGRLTRKYGFTADNLLGADVVTADGRLRIAGPDREPDLFWAIRGGGGNFGVVTSFEFRLHPVREVWLDMAWWPADRTAEVLRFWRDWSAGQPPELATSSIVVTAPGNRGFPADIVGRPFVVITNLWHGPVADGPAVTGPVRQLGEPAVAVSRVTSYAAAQSMNDGIANADFGYRDCNKTGYIADLSDAAIDTYAEWAQRMPSPWSLVELIAIDGPGTRLDQAATPLGARSARFNHIITGGWRDPADDAVNLAWASGFHAAMAPHYNAGVYLNYLDQGEPEEVIRSAYGPANWERLRRLKTRFDPENLFRRNHNIPPLAPAPRGSAR